MVVTTFGSGRVQRRRARWLVGVLAALALLAAACGGDDDGDEPVTIDTPDATSEADGGEGDLGGGSGDESQAPESGGGGGSGDSPVADFASQLQGDLGELGFYEGPITGEYDAATQEALKAFQEFAGLSADGIYGPQTAAALDVAMGRAAGESNTSALQTALAELCYYTGPIDGDYGPMTTEAVRSFQADNGVPVDGFYGPETATALVEAWPSRPSDCGGDSTEPGDGDDGGDAGGGGSGAAVSATVDGTTIDFDSNVSCVLGPDDSGSISADAADGSSISVLLSGTASRVTIDGPSGSVDAPVTNIANDQTTLTVQADPPPTTVTVALSACSGDGSSGPDQPTDAIVAVADGTTITFNESVSCVLGPDDAGSISGVAEDGTTLNVTLDGTASRVTIEGPSGSFDAPVTLFSNEGGSGVTVEAAPPPIQITVAAGTCTEA